MHRLIWVAIPVMFTTGLSFAPRPGSSKNLQEQSDNAKLSKGDASKDATAADQQKMNPADRAIGQKIPAEIMKDKSLPTDAHNIKTISQDRKNTLKGPLRTAEEKGAVEDKAADVAGERNGTSDIANVPPKS